MLANGAMAGIIRSSPRQRLAAGGALSFLLWYFVLGEQNGGFDETSGLGRASTPARQSLALPSLLRLPPLLPNTQHTTQSAAIGWSIDC
jgi:hypothetical protein